MASRPINWQARRRAMAHVNLWQGVRPLPAPPLRSRLLRRARRMAERVLLRWWPLLALALWTPLLWVVWA